MFEQVLFRVLDKKAETRSNLIQSLFSFPEHGFYFVCPGLFHCYSRATNIYVHHACVNSRVYHSRLTIKHFVISTTTTTTAVVVVKKVFDISMFLVV